MDRLDHVHPDSKGRLWHFQVYPLTGGWFWEISVESPELPDPEFLGPFLNAEEARRVAQIWIEGR